MSGVAGWLLSLFLDRILAKASDFLTRLWKDWQESKRRTEQEKIDAENAAKYEKIVGEDGKPTEQELEDATSDLLNGRKR